MVLLDLGRRVCLSIPACDGMLLDMGELMQQRPPYVTASVTCSTPFCAHLGEGGPCKARATLKVCDWWWIFQKLQTNHPTRQSLRYSSC